MCFEIETIDPETGKKHNFYKAIKFLRIRRLPKNAKQSTAFMDMQTQIMSGVYEGGYNLITIIANMIKPVPLGLLFLYGVQGTGSNIDDAKYVVTTPSALVSYTLPPEMFKENTIEISLDSSMLPAVRRTT